jgi:UrcA family protein
MVPQRDTKEHAMIRNFTKPVLVLAAIAGFAGAATAETVTVSSADLNLTSEAGLRSLNHRISAAVTTVCGATDPRNLTEMSSIESCRKTAMASATQQVAALLDHNQRSASRNTDVQVADR